MTAAIQKPKVLIITGTDLGKSGVPYVIYSVVKSLHDYFDFDIVTFHEGNHYYQRLIEEGINNVTLQNYEEKEPKTYLGKLNWLLFSQHRKNYKIAKKALKNKKYYAVHCFMEFYSYGALKAAEEAGIEKRILHVNIDHKTSASKSLKSKLINWIEKRNRRLSLNYATERVGVSIPCCEHAFGDAKHTTLYNSYDEAHYNHDLNCSLEKDQLVLTQVASISQNKNQLFTVRIAEELKKYTNNFKVILIGWAYEKNYYQKLLDYIKSENLSDNVDVIDGNTLVSPYFPKTSYGILPSISEAASITAIEFQAAGIPIFVSSSVPKDVDCGGAIYLPLEKGAKEWAYFIWDYFKKNGNKRRNYDVSRFSSASFKMSLMKIYNVK